MRTVLFFDPNLLAPGKEILACVLSPEETNQLAENGGTDQMLIKFWGGGKNLLKTYKLSEERVGPQLVILLRIRRSDLEWFITKFRQHDFQVEDPIYLKTPSWAELLARSLPVQTGTVFVFLDSSRLVHRRRGQLFMAMVFQRSKQRPITETFVENTYLEYLNEGTVVGRANNGAAEMMQWALRTYFSREVKIQEMDLEPYTQLLAKRAVAESWKQP